VCERDRELERWKEKESGLVNGRGGEGGSYMRNRLDWIEMWGGGRVHERGKTKNHRNTA